MKLAAEILIREVDGKSADDDVMLEIVNDGGDETNLLFRCDDKKISITLDRDELLEAVARVSGNDIRIAKEV